MLVQKYKAKALCGRRASNNLSGSGCRSTGSGHASNLRLRRELRSDLISAYLHLLEEMIEPIASESMLPYPKEKIRCALLEELTENPGCDLAHELAMACVQLESFVRPDEYQVVADFKKASRLAEMADLEDPASILRSARIMKDAKGEHAVRIEEKVSRKIRERFLQIQELCLGGFRRKPVFNGLRQLYG